MDVDGRKLKKAKPFANWNGVRGVGAGKVAKDIRDLPLPTEDSSNAGSIAADVNRETATIKTLNEELQGSGNAVSSRLRAALRDAVARWGNRFWIWALIFTVGSVGIPF